MAVAYDAYFAWQRVLANAAVSGVLMMLGVAITRRLWFSFVLVALAMLALLWISATKLRLLGVPLLLQDMYFIQQFDISTLHLFSEYIDQPSPAVSRCWGQAHWYC